MKLRQAQRRCGRRAVLVHWIDSAHSNGWTADSDAPQGFDIFTVGWLITKTRTMLTVGASATAATSSDPQSMAPVAIPRRAIVSWRYLR